MLDTKRSTFILTVLFVFFVALPMLGQELERASQEELQKFWNQYWLVSQTGNSQKMQQLIRENREQADMLSEFLFQGGKEAYRFGDYETALETFRSVQELYQQLGNKIREAEILGYIGSIFWNNHKYQQALQYYQEALALSQGAGDDPGQMITLNNIGSVYQETGQYQQALHYYQEALIIGKELDDMAGKATLLNNIGGIYQMTGEYQHALSYFHEALEIRKARDDRIGTGITLSNIGSTYQIAGDYQRALNYFQEVLLLRRELHDKDGETRTLNSIGGIYQQSGDAQQALDYFQEALSISRASNNTFEERGLLNNIGAIYQDAGTYQQALSFYQDSLSISQEIGDTKGEISTLNNIGTVYSSIGEDQHALDYYQAALEMSRESGDKAAEKITLSNLGSLCEQLGKWEEAILWYKQAINLVEEIRSKAGENDIKESFLARQFDIYPVIVRLLLQLGVSDEAFTYAERSKARSFFEQLHEASTGIERSINPQLIEEEYTLYDKLSTIEHILDEKLSTQERNRLLKERNTLEQELFIFKQKLKTATPRYAEIRYPEPVTINRIQQEILNEGDVLVEYLLGEEELYAFIIGKTHFFTHTFGINGQDLAGKPFEILHPIPNASRETFDRELAHQLYQLLFQPLEPKIAKAIQGKKIHTLLIVPDSLLFYLPFEMLVAENGENPEYLVDRYTLSYAPSASVLLPEILHARQSRQYTQDLLALAPFGEGKAETTQAAMKAAENQLLSDTLRSGLEGVQPLPYSVGEVQTISKLYPQSVFKIGTDASKAYLRDHIKGNRYLHLSTHGYLDSEHAMYSGLLFSDGMLQTYEIFNLDIDAELTVLSACETGLGELKAGEGLVGLTRAFMYAGSPSVLVSLWPVSDPSTAAFMKRFYRNLKKGMSKAESLQETKIWMKKKSYHTDENGNIIKHDDPFYWAPFILVGAHE